MHEKNMQLLLKIHANLPSFKYLSEFNMYKLQPALFVKVLETSAEHEVFQTVQINYKPNIQTYFC